MGIRNESSPCLGCTRVHDPRECENKNCKPWRQWFLARWALIHAYPRRQREKAPEPVGVVLGGQYYAAPHQVRAYLAEDPCACCRCAADLCRTPCRARVTWAVANQGVRQ